LCGQLFSDDAICYPPDLTDDELLAEARATSRNVTVVGPTYLEELNGRTTARQTAQLITLTDELRAPTSQIRWLTGAAIVLAVASVVVGSIRANCARR
jgi:hypothetical protein